MCGICGILTLNGLPVEKALIRRMCAKLSRRGPDDEGIYLGGGKGGGSSAPLAGLGHRRLSIIDLSEAGRQPMCNEDGRIWVVLNGEIYNYREIRTRLIQRGHRFKSNSDTEVILHLYEEKGTRAVEDLNGMFAFALWDENRARLWLCRDRSGIKPLVYFWNSRKLVFASRIDALLQDEQIARRLDSTSLALYLTFNYIPAPRTIYQSIFKLPPAHSLILERGALHIERYWRVPQAVDPELGALPFRQRKAVASEKLKDALHQAVSDQMISDVPLGAFLSGGIDSSIIVSLMARCSREPIQTFSIGFKDLPVFDETRYARMVAKHCHTDHHEFQLTSQAMIEVLDEVMDDFDEPFADSSAIPTFVVSRQTRKHVTVALSGDGGDELFAGYRSYFLLQWRKRYLLLPTLLRQRFIEPLFERLPEARDRLVLEYVRRAKKFIRSAQEDFFRSILSLKEVFPAPLRRRIFIGATTGTEKDPALRHVEENFNYPDVDPLNRILHADFIDSLPGDMLCKVDWMSMHHGLEVRVPFLDHRVVELAFRMPGNLKIRHIHSKYILKSTFRPILPPALYRRRKAGFEVPISRWLRTDLRFLVERYLNGALLRRQGIFDPDIVDTLIQAHWMRSADASWLLWNLIVFNRWFERYAPSID